MGLLKIFKKTKPVAVKKPKPIRVSVHNKEVTYVHWCVYITKHNDGGITLHDGVGGGDIVAKYTVGSWESLSVGKRAVHKNE